MRLASPTKVGITTCPIQPEAAVQRLLGKYRRGDVGVYLGALVVQDARFRANLRPTVERILSEAKSDQSAPASANI